MSSIPGPGAWCLPPHRSRGPLVTSPGWKAEGVTGPLCSGIPRGPGVGRGGSCSCSASSKFLQIINWPRLPLCSTGPGPEKLEVGSGRGKGAGGQALGEGTLWETQVPRLKIEGKWELGANTQRGREGMLEEEASGALIPHPPKPSRWASGMGEGQGGHQASGTREPHPTFFSSSPFPPLPTPSQRSMPS